MTEEDTFNRLRRISFGEMTRIWFRSPLTLHGLWRPGDPVPEDIEKVFFAHGWTLVDWHTAYRQNDRGIKWMDPELDYD